MLYTLNQLAAVLEYRKGRLAETGCPNLDAYNEATGEGLPRLIFACDEVAEVLDRTGRSKEDKERLGQIENKLSTLARLGRAFGIHLILSTQRPDAAHTDRKHQYDNPVQPWEEILPSAIDEQMCVNLRGQCGQRHQISLKSNGWTSVKHGKQE